MGHIDLEALDAATYEVIASDIGSKSGIAGWPECSLQGLFQALRQWTLDARLEGNKRDDPDDARRGPFRGRCWGNCQKVYDTYNHYTYTVGTRPIYPDRPNAVRYFGNFVGYSYGFWLDTDDEALMAVLDGLIAENMQREDYLAAKKKPVSMWQKVTVSPVVPRVPAPFLLS